VSSFYFSSLPQAGVGAHLASVLHTWLMKYGTRGSVVLKFLTRKDFSFYRDLAEHIFMAGSYFLAN